MPRLWLQANRVWCDVQEDDAGSADGRAVQEVARPIRRQLRHSTTGLPIVFVNVTNTVAGAKARPAYSTETRTTPASIMPRPPAAFTHSSMIRPRMNGPLSATRHWIDRPEEVTVTSLPTERVR